MTSMSGENLDMDSEKEENAIIADQIDGDVQHEEVVPGSSPEGEFPNSKQQSFEGIEQQNEIEQHHVQIHADELKNGEEIVDGQEQNGEMLVEDGDQNYTDQFVDLVQITQEDIYEAGFHSLDFNRLTEEQLRHIVAISQRREAKQNGEGQHGECPEDGHHMVHFENGNDGGGEMNEYVGEDGHHLLGENEWQLTLHNDGGVIMSDANHQEYYISQAELTDLNIDLNDIQQEQVQHLVQAIYQDKVNTKTDGAPYSGEDASDQQPSTSYHHNSQQLETQKEHRIPMIGETVQVRTNDGRFQEAVVKYIRGESEFKIQFMDGEFAYATMDQMVVSPRIRDHDGYQLASPMLIRRTDMARMSAQKRAASGEDLCPPVLKRSYQLAPVVGGSHVVQSPNFCCPICDKKVFQKEPSYIVIRLPACDACTREKIIVLDDQVI